MRKRVRIVDFTGKISLLVLAFVLMSASVFAQKITVKGTVTDNSNSGIPGVTVVLKGTTAGTITDIDGKYSLTFDKGDGEALLFSFVGYNTEEVPIAGKTIIDVELNENVEQLEDVVVVGFGQQKKETVVGSITQAKGEELLKAGNVTTVSEALTGLLPGVSTMQASGQPGATDATILIRGQSSWNNNTPLFMVDGVERDFNDLDPNEIESISVLKDASATAVFGVKAANGVILITTKRGTSGKPKVTFSGNEGIKVPVINTDYYVPYHENLQYYNMAILNEQKYSLLRQQGEINAWADPNRDPDYYSYTNWVNEMVTSGRTRAYNINIQGGSDFVKYFTSFGYNYDGDMFNVEKQELWDPRTSQKRYNWRSNLDFNFTKTTKLRVNLSGDFKDWHGNVVSSDNNFSGIGEGGSSMSRLYQAVQVGAPPILSDGKLGVDPSVATDWFKFNYKGEMEREGEYSRRSTRIFSDVVFEQKFLKYFMFKGKLSYNFTRSYNNRLQVHPIYYETDYTTGQVKQYGSDEDAVESLPTLDAESLSSYAQQLYYEASLNFNKTFNNDHSVSALALFSRREARNQVAFPSYEESWVGRATYDYKKKYLVEFNGAYNGSEKFAPGLRYGFFPSIATGWVLSEENFFKENINFMDFMKIRYSWGEIGSDRGAARFTYISQYSTKNYSSSEGGGGHPGGYGTIWTAIGSGSNGTLFLEGQPANANATWETAVKQNLGVEMSFLGGDLKANLDLFDEYRTGILMERRTIPPWYGNVFPDANMGATKNHGFDFELKYNKRIDDNWTVNLSGNVSISENRIVERDDPQFTPDYQKQSGKPIGWSAGYIDDGLLGGWNDVYNYTPSSLASLIPGDMIFVDYNADGVIDQLDKAPIGEPSYASKTYAFNLGFSYKNFSVSAMFNGMWDLSKALSNNYLWEFTAMGGLNFTMLDTEMLNFWTPENPEATHPALRTVDNKHNSQGSTYTRRPADFLRLRNLELKYRIRGKDVPWLSFVNNLEVYVNGNNLLTWSKLPDQFDPEARKLEVYPIAKRYNMGLRFSF